MVNQSQPWDTLTRTEALKERGYPPEIVNGNGSAVAPPQPAEVAVPAEHSDGEGRRCSECGGPIPLEFHTNRKTCSRACSDHREARQSGSRSRERGRNAPNPKSGVRNLAAPQPDREARNLCRLLESLAGQLSPAWQAQLELSEVILSWRPASSETARRRGFRAPSLTSGQGVSGPKR